MEGSKFAINAKYQRSESRAVELAAIFTSNSNLNKVRVIGVMVLGQFGWFWVNLGGFGSKLGASKLGGGDVDYLR